MDESVNKGGRDNKNKITRRDFLKNAGFITGGVALTSMAIASGCTNDAVPPTTTPGTTTPPTTTTPGTTTPTPTTTPGTTTPQPTTTPGNGEFVYVPPDTYPERVDVPGCVSDVAIDRLYSIDHVWVKLLDNNLAVLGITDKMQLLIGLTGSLDTIYLLEPGSPVTFDGFLGNIEGKKLNADIYSPLSGIVVQANKSLYINALAINREPYREGWLYVIQYTNPQELDYLVSAVEYSEMNANPDA